MVYSSSNNLLASFIIDNRLWFFSANWKSSDYAEKINEFLEGTVTKELDRLSSIRLVERVGSEKFYIKFNIADQYYDFKKELRSITKETSDDYFSLEELDRLLDR